MPATVNRPDPTASAAARQARLRLRRRAAGMCLLCSRPKEGRFAHCAYHREQKRWRDMLPEARAQQAATQKRYRARKALERVYAAAR